MSTGGPAQAGGGCPALSGDRELGLRGDNWHVGWPRASARPPRAQQRRDPCRALSAFLEPAERVMARSPGSGPHHLGSELPLPLRALWLQGGDFTSLRLIFPIWKMGVRR